MCAEILYVLLTWDASLSWRKLLCMHEMLNTILNDLLQLSCESVNRVQQPWYLAQAKWFALVQKGLYTALFESCSCWNILYCIFYCALEWSLQVFTGRTV